jgi:hypothetical protein
MERLMRREILDVRRCPRCHEVVQAYVDDAYNAGSPDEEHAVYWLPRRAHSRADCDRMLTLAREEWPTLFDL